MIHSASLFLVLIFAFTFATRVHGGESLEQTIGYPLNYLANSKNTFIRNGATHTSDEATKHIKAKCEHFKADIKTPEDFIRLSASKSLLSGKPYLVRTSAGKEVRLDEWLTEALKQHREQAPQ